VRAVVIAKHGGIDVLQVQERPEPRLGPGRVRIDVRAAGVNFADTLARVGLYPDAPKPPCVVGYEVAGTIAAVGDGVDAARVGERVMAGTAFGGYASQVVVPEGDVVALPERLSFEEGAAVPVVYATAWAALYGYGSLRAGERVLVHAAAGGVGIAVLQLAKRGGAEIHGTASPGKHDRLRELGLDRAIDYHSDGWWRDLPRYDLIVDGIGGASFERSNALLRAGGRLVGLGASSVQQGEIRSLRRALPQALRMMRGFDLLKQMGESKSFIGINMKRLWDGRGTLAPWMEPLRAFLDDGTVAPVVHAAVPFDRAAEAHRILAARENVGKVVLVPQG
jgi:NADPH:quinone reductase-like Zn-dependent oxidoreductase